MCCALHIAHCTLNNAQCPMQISHCTLCIAQFILHIYVHICTYVQILKMWGESFAIHRISSLHKIYLEHIACVVNCTLNIAHWNMHNAQCKFHIAHRTRHIAHVCTYAHLCINLKLICYKPLAIYLECIAHFTQRPLIAQNISWAHCTLHRWRWVWYNSAVIHRDPLIAHKLYQAQIVLLYAHIAQFYLFAVLQFCSVMLCPAHFYRNAWNLCSLAQLCKTFLDEWVLVNFTVLHSCIVNLHICSMTLCDTVTVLHMSLLSPLFQWCIAASFADKVEDKSFDMKWHILQQKNVQIFTQNVIIYEIIGLTAKNCPMYIYIAKVLLHRFTKQIEPGSWQNLYTAQYWWQLVVKFDLKREICKYFATKWCDKLLPKSSCKSTLCTTLQTLTGERGGLGKLP